jgi:hypothetical protein
VSYNVRRGGGISAQVDPGDYPKGLDFAGLSIGEARMGE